MLVLILRPERGECQVGVDSKKLVRIGHLRYFPAAEVHKSGFFLHGAKLRVDI